MAEATNLIKPLTQRVMDIALRQVAEWQAIGLQLSVAVNVSAQVLVDQSFADPVLAALQRASVGPERLNDFGTGYSSLASLADLPCRRSRSTARSSVA